MKYQQKKGETYKAITELIKDGDFTTGNSLNYEYFIANYKLIAVDLSKQRPDFENKQKSEFENQQINFIGELEQNATISFIIEEKQTGLEFSQYSLSIV